MSEVMVEEKAMENVVEATTDLMEQIPEELPSFEKVKFSKKDGLVVGVVAGTVVVTGYVGKQLYNHFKKGQPFTGPMKVFNKKVVYGTIHEVVEGDVEAFEETEEK